MSKQSEALRLADALESCLEVGGSSSDAMGLTDWSQKQCDLAAAELRRLHSVNAGLLAALEKLLKRDEINTCQHQQTHRGGVLWTICDDCRMKWADDEGGKPKWRDPPEWRAARVAISLATTATVATPES